MTGPAWFSQGEPHLPSDRAWLGPRERERAATMRYAKRHDEFLVSRWTAKNAVVLAARTGPHPDAELRPGDVEILPAPDGAPVAHVRGRPWGRRLSMTDRAGWAVCLVSDSGTEVGCDLELVEPRSPAFVSDWFTPPERDVVAQARDDDERHLRANLIWSAKESALKVLRTGLRRSTHSVVVDARLDGVPAPGWSPLVVTAAEGAVFPGWWRRFGAFVLTVCAEEPLPAPRALVEPPALESAVPAHSWMARPLR